MADFRWLHRVCACLIRQSDDTRQDIRTEPCAEIAIFIGEQAAMRDLRLLPSGFEELEHHLDYWDRPDSHQRWAQRQAASPESLRGFYDDVLVHAEAAMKYLEGKALDSIEGADARLLSLMLSWIHASIGVEIHGQPRVPHAPYPHMVRIDHFETAFR